MYQFLSGMIAAGYLIAALFFCRFWKRTGDFLFAIFAVSFSLFAISQGTSLLWNAAQENRTWVYLFRLVGFTLLLVAIAVKNKGKSSAH